MHRSKRRESFLYAKVEGTVNERFNTTVLLKLEMKCLVELFELQYVLQNQLQR